MVKKVDPKMRDFASRLALVARISSRNLRPTFLTVHLTLTMHPESELVCHSLADAVVRRARVDPGVGAAHGGQAQLGADIG